MYIRKLLHSYGLDRIVLVNLKQLAHTWVISSDATLRRRLGAATARMHTHTCASRHIENGPVWTRWTAFRMWVVPGVREGASWKRSLTASCHVISGPTREIGKLPS